MIGFYTNTIVDWQKVSGKNEYNERTFANAVAIRCRLEDVMRLVRTATGTEVVSSTTVFTETAVSPHDLIDGRPVLNVNKMRGLDGEVWHYEVYLG